MLVTFWNKQSTVIPKAAETSNPADQKRNDQNQLNKLTSGHNQDKNELQLSLEAGRVWDIERFLMVLGRE